MLEGVLKGAMHGITVIEEEIACVSPILATQIATFGRNYGKRVVYLKIGSEEHDNGPIGELRGSGVVVGSGESGIGNSPSFPYGQGQNTLVLDGIKFDLIVIQSISTYLFDKTEEQVVEVVKEIERLSKQGKGLVITFERPVVSERIAGYLLAVADNIIIVKTRLTSERIERMLYVPRIKGESVPDKLIKITLSNRTVLEDTGELIG